MENHNDNNKNLLIINQTSYLSKFSENRRLRGFSFVPNLSKISSEFSFSKNIKIQIHKYTNTQIHKYTNTINIFKARKILLVYVFLSLRIWKMRFYFFYAVCGNSRGATGFRFAAVIEVV